MTRVLSNGAWSVVVFFALKLRAWVVLMASAEHLPTGQAIHIINDTIYYTLLISGIITALVAVFNLRALIRGRRDRTASEEQTPRG